MTPACERVAFDGSGAAAIADRLRGSVARPEGIAEAVATTIAEVRERGDEAVLELGERFDGTRATSLRVEAGAIAAALQSIEPALRSALELAAANIRAVAEAQLPAPAIELELPQGQRLTLDAVAVGAAGVYAPGGRAAYPSSVLMGVIPALVAGVGRVAVASPPGPDGLPSQSVLAAAALTGAHEVFAAGGAQAIAALALGTESIAPVDVIAGPGGPWVQEAKLQLAGEVGIDAYAGPSELMVIADGDGDADWIALDVCAQAEHGTDGLLVVASESALLLDAVEERIGALAGERPSVADATVQLVETGSAEDALALAQALAPEHLELSGADSEQLADAVSTAGCVFVGSRSATAFGDYAAGSNHVLPTGGAGRFSGPLGPGTFRRRTSRVDLTGASDDLGDAVATIARAEGFPVHGESALARRIDPAKERGDGPIG